MQIEGEDNEYDLQGNLTYDTVPDLFERNSPAVSGSIILNLSHVGRVDSAGLALLVEWSCQARERNEQLVLRNVPDQLKSLIDASGLQAILPISRR